VTAAADTSVDVRQSVSNSWWILLLWGIATVVIGGYLLFQPIGTLRVLIIVMGAYWLVGGVFDVVGALTNRDRQGWGWRLAGAILSIIAGAIVLANPLLGGFVTLAFMYYMLAFSAIVNGVINMFVGNREREAAGGQWSWGSFLLGLVQLVIGIFLLFNPLAGILALVPVLAIFAIITGIAAIFISFRVRSMA